MFFTQSQDERRKTDYPCTERRLATLKLHTNDKLDTLNALSRSMNYRVIGDREDYEAVMKELESVCVRL